MFLHEQEIKKTLAAYLPRNAPEGEEEEVVCVEPVPPAPADVPHPLLRPVRPLDGLHRGVPPGEGDADPLQCGGYSHSSGRRRLSDV